VLLAVGGAFVYIHFISGPAPAPLALKTGPAPAATTPVPQTEPIVRSGSLAGRWRVAAGSVVGYRVNEVLAGQQNVAVGRTSQVSGSMTIAGTSVTAARFSVRVATIHSDESQRDAQFNGRIMDTSAFPAGTLKLTSAIALAPLPAAGVIKSYHATADLTLHGQTRPVPSRCRPSGPAAASRCPGRSRSCSPAGGSPTRASPRS